MKRSLGRNWRNSFFRVFNASWDDIRLPFERCACAHTASKRLNKAKMAEQVNLA